MLRSLKEGNVLNGKERGAQPCFHLYFVFLKLFCFTGPSCYGAQLLGEIPVDCALSETARILCELLK